MADPTSTSAATRFGRFPALSAIGAPLALFASYLFLSRLAVRSLHVPADIVACLICTLFGCVPILRLAEPMTLRVACCIIYLLLAILVLPFLGYLIDCSFFGGCD
jgi:hypothetical protein